MQAPVLNYEQAVQRLSGRESQVRALGVTRLALFGSVLRGDARPQSDVDLLVQFAPGAKSFDRFLALSELLETQLGRPVELVTLEALSPFIGPRILADAQDVLRATAPSCGAWRSSAKPQRRAPRTFGRPIPQWSGVRWPACGTD